MGSDLDSENTQNFEFMIWAKKDSIGANLDRIQVIKGWHKDGQLHEKIFNVSLSDGRVVNDDGTVPDNGATVDLKTGEWSKDKGAEELFIVWDDEEFDPETRAFYYVRVIEIPTASWQLWDQISEPYFHDSTRTSLVISHLVFSLILIIYVISINDIFISI